MLTTEDLAAITAEDIAKLTDPDCERIFLLFQSAYTVRRAAALEDERIDAVLAEALDQSGLGAGEPWTVRRRGFPWGARVSYIGKNWVSAATLNRSEPGTNSDWIEVTGEYPEWTRMPWPRGAIVTWEDKDWLSTRPNNIFEPGSFVGRNHWSIVERPEQTEQGEP